MTGKPAPSVWDWKLCLRERTEAGSGSSLWDRGCASGIVHWSFIEARVRRERGRLGAGGSPASLEASNRAPDTQSVMDPVRVLALVRLRTGGLGAMRKVASPTPPLVPSALKPAIVRFPFPWLDRVAR